MTALHIPIISLSVLMKLNLSLNATVLSWLLVLPACIDYMLIRREYVEPNNKRRFVTGMMLGISFALLSICSFLMYNVYIVLKRY